jgi:hypothetical protein
MIHNSLHHPKPDFFRTVERFLQTPSGEFANGYLADYLQNARHSDSSF